MGVSGVMRCWRDSFGWPDTIAAAARTTKTVSVTLSMNSPSKGGARIVRSISQVFREPAKAVNAEERAHGPCAEGERNPDDGIVVPVEPEARVDKQPRDEQPEEAQSAHDDLHARYALFQRRCPGLPLEQVGPLGVPSPKEL